MNTIEGKFGFETFDFPEYELEMNDNELIIKCYILDGEFENDWFEISGFNFAEDSDDLHFDFNSSKGSEHEGLKEVARNFIRMSIISIIENQDELAKELTDE